MSGKRIFVFALFALAALALALSAKGAAEAQTYRPYNSHSLANTAPGASSDRVVGFGIAAPDYNFEDASMTILQPPDGWTAMGLEAPVGAKVGTLSTSVAGGVLGSLCNLGLTPSFTLYNASVNIAFNPIEILWILKSSPIPDTDGDGIWDYLERYPQFLNTMLDPDGSGPLLPLQPRARLAGHASVAGKWVLVQLLIFSPGQMTQLGGIYSQMTADKGAPALIVLNDPTGAGEAEPGAIADFCTPLSYTATLYGVTQDNPNTAANEAGYTRQTNPAAGTGILATGTHIARNYSQSERDADGDGFENDLDACPYTVDIAAWNPRVYSCLPGSQPGDQDCDMLPSSCDPNDNQFDTDQDADGYYNAQDNCPLVANGCQDAACGIPFSPSWDNQEDRDAGLANADQGPRSDALGDACDDSDDDGNEDGAGAGTCNDGIDNGGDTLVDGADPNCAPSMDSVDWPPVPATNPQNGAYYHRMPWAAVCVGAVDTDSDGYCDALETMLGSPANNGPETGVQCANAIDDDGDGYVNDGCPRVGEFSETGAQCANAVSDDTPTPDTWESPAVVNDGCPTIGIPESLVIDAAITAAAAQPAATAPQSCSDGLDNDNDGAVDGADGGAFGCQAASYAGDGDFDGIPDGSDNCPVAWNPTQTNTDNGFTARPPIFPAGDPQGDACDSDDDADGYTDVREYYLPTDPLRRCVPAPVPQFRSDAWPLDQDTNGTITVVGDVLKYAGKIGNSVTGSPPDSWARSRLDLDGNGTITVVGDVLKYSGNIGRTCT